MSDDDTTGSDTLPPPRPWSDVLDQVRDALEDAGIGAQEITSEPWRASGSDWTPCRGARRPGRRPIRRLTSALRSGWCPAVAGKGSRPRPAPGPISRWPNPNPSGAGPRPCTTMRPTRSPPNVSVRVRTVDRGTGGAAPGDIAVSPDAPAQTVFRGATPRPYRVRCVTGALRVEFDGSPPTTSGQSMDVEAGLIRVSAADGAAATGAYLRLAR